LPTIRAATKLAASAPRHACHWPNCASTSASAATPWLWGLPAPEWTRRPNAKDDGQLSRRDLLLLGAVAYWCEGTKAKPWRPTSLNLQFINGDETLILLFLRFVEALGVDRTTLRYRLSIHESADVQAATRSWAEVVGVPAERFQRATLKTHNPSTVRRNTGYSYRGCLVVYVPKSARLYWVVEGVMRGLALSEPAVGGR
jgi:hypothetical protein